MKHVIDVPYAWYERKTSNPWYDVATRKVVLPDTIKYKTNYTLTQAEMDEFVDLLKRTHLFTEHRFARTRSVAEALRNGYVRSFMPDPGPPVTLSRMLEYINDGKKFELELTQLMLKITRRMNKLKLESETVVKPEAQEGDPT